MSEEPSTINSTALSVGATAIAILVGFLLYISLRSQGQANLYMGCIQLRTQINSSAEGWDEFMEKYPNDAKTILQKCLNEASPPVNLDP